MTDLFSSTAMQAALLIAVLCVLCAAAFYLLSSFRDYTAQDRQTPAATLANFEEMRSKGDISDEEFRTIQASAQRHAAEEVQLRAVESTTQGDATSPGPSPPNT